MRKKLVLPLLGSLLLFSCADSNREAFYAKELPVSKVVMYQSGVGYVERIGKVDGDELVLRIKTNQINDILKSLTVIDRGNGRPVSISLPVSQTALDSLTEIPPQIAQGGGILALINAFRGAHVFVKAKGKSLEGRIVGVEYNATGVNEDEVVGQWVVTFMTKKSTLELIKLEDIRSLELYDKSLSVGLDKSLDISLGAGEWKPIELRVRMSNKANREIAMSYIVAMPTWKPAYRLILGEENTGTLQGWAVISNVSGSAWDNIAFSLVSGQPMSFTYDLYSPLFVKRPDLTAEARTTAIAPRPQAASDGAMPKAAPRAPMAAGSAGRPSAARGGAMKKTARDSGAMAYDSIAYEEEAMWDEDYDFARTMEVPPAPAPISAEEYQSGFEALASTQQVGAFYEYKVASSLTVPDGASALVNLLQQKVPSVEARLFDSMAVKQTSSFQTVQLQNNSDVALEAGPITIYKGSAFIGEGYMTRTEPGQTAQITFAADDRMTLSMVSEPYAPPTNVVIDRIDNGYIYTTGTIGETLKYTLENKADMDLTALIKRPVRSNWSLLDPPEGMLTSSGHHYIPVDVDAKSKREYLVKSTSKSTTSYSLMSTLGSRALADALPNSELPDDLRANAEAFIEQFKKLDPIDDRLKNMEERKAELDKDERQITQSLKDLKDIKTSSANKLIEDLIKRQSNNEKELAKLATDIAKLRMERSEIDVTMRALVREMRYSK